MIVDRHIEIKVSTFYRGNLVNLSINDPLIPEDPSVPSYLQGTMPTISVSLTADETRLLIQDLEDSLCEVT